MLVAVLLIAAMGLINRRSFEHYSFYQAALFFPGRTFFYHDHPLI